jgi:cytidyltransferase-like protein
MPIAIVSMYADPLHVGHCYLLKEAKKLGSVYVIINNDHQAGLKKGQSLMNQNERLEIIRSLSNVDFAIIACDDDRTVCRTLRQLAGDISTSDDIFFVNGGDQTNESIPEAAICKELGIKLIDGVGEKVQSSSLIIKRAQTISDYKKI